jgi:hypothetical protein
VRPDRVSTIETRTPFPPFSNGRLWPPTCVVQEGVASHTPSARLARAQGSLWIRPRYEAPPKENTPPSAAASQ